jgi:riboflavin synthase alpha subunit
MKMRNPDPSKKSLFPYFTGYTKGQFQILEKTQNTENGTHQFKISLDADLLFKKRDIVQLDGILFEVIEHAGNHLIVSTTDELINNTALKNKQNGDKISLGIVANLEPKENTGYLIEASSQGIVTVISNQVQPDHQYTRQIDLYSEYESPLIQEGQHIGLSGSSLTVRNLQKYNGGLRFSIFCGKQTQEISCFNEKLEPGAQINFTEPKFTKN